MERSIDAKMLQLQMMRESPGSIADHQRVDAELAQLRRSVEEANTSRAAAADRVLELAQQKQEQAFMAQERRHIDALRASQESSTAALTAMVNKSASDTQQLITMLTKSTDAKDEATLKVLNEMSGAIQAHTAAATSIAQNSQLSNSELVSSLHAGFQELNSNLQNFNANLREQTTSLSGAVQSIMLQVQTDPFTFFLLTFTEQSVDRPNVTGPGSKG
jgi:hypothetical protein